jgi:hypothetical protein
MCVLKSSSLNDHSASVRDDRFHCFAATLRFDVLFAVEVRRGDQ